MHVARVLLLGGLLFIVAVLWLLDALYEENLSRELEQRARFLTQAAESNGRWESAVGHDASWDAGVLLDRISLLAAGTPRAVGFALVDLDGSRVIAVKQLLWEDRPVVVTALQPLFLGASRWRLGRGQQALAMPVVIPAFGSDLRLVTVLETGSIEEASRQTLALVALTIVAGVILLMLGAWLVLRSRVLRPIEKIQTAVVQRRDQFETTGGVPEQIPIPKLHDDEIGNLADLLDQSLSELEQLDDRVHLLSRAIQGSSNEVYIVDAETLEFRFVNDTAAINLGYEAEELIGMRIPDVASEMREQSAVIELAKELVQSGELRHCYTHVRRDGSEYPLEFNAMLVEQNQRRLLIVLGNDVSEKHEREQALRESEERLKLAVEGSDNGVFDYDVGNEVLYLSDRVKNWLSLSDPDPATACDSPADTLLNRVLEQIHPGDRPAVDHALTECLQRGRDFDIEFRLADRISPCWLLMRGRPTWSDAATPARISGFVSNITRRKVAEHLLNDSVVRLGAVLDNIAEGIVTLDAVGLVCAVNPAGEQMLDCDSETLVSQPFNERLEVQDDWATLADEQVPVECLGVRASGETFPVELAVSTLGIGAEEQFIVVFRDISDRKSAEAELYMALEETRAATLAKDEFLATMSHEIRTPMNGVLGMTQLLLDMSLTEAQRETAEVIYSSGEALLAIINDILDFSKIEAGKLAFESVPFDLRSSIGEVMDLLASNNRTLDLYVDYPAEVPSQLLGDVGRIRQVLMNLIGNAVKFTEQGHVLVSVSNVDPSGEPSNARLKVSVVDTGPGIGRGAKKRLFESFSQADASTTRRYGGTGLGLAICRRLVEMMGGQIGVTSEPGAGAAFWFTLNLPTGGEDGLSPVPRVLAGRRVLVVDDNPIGREIYQRILIAAGMEVDVAEGAQQALQHIDERPPYDLALLDYHMPEMDGLELAARLRQEARCGETRLVMLSSSDIRGDDVVSILDGCAVKPVLQDSLYRLLMNALGVRSRRSAVLEPLRQDPEGPLRLRVLLAEDNLVNQKVAVRMLENLGCLVDVAKNGREAVKMWEKFPYSLVFMDCQMPEVDGLEATRRIRQLELLDGGRTPIVAMTANVLRKDQDACAAAGMDDYLAKPVKAPQIESALQRWCGSAEEDASAAPGA